MATISNIDEREGVYLTQSQVSQRLLSETDE